MSKFNLKLVAPKIRLLCKLLLSVQWRLVIVFGFLFKMDFAAATNDYPQLYENKSSSQNYEVVKLIDGPIDSVYGVNNSGDFIAQSGESLWKINAAGEVIDYFRSSDFYSSGLIIKKEGFIDWAFTGDKNLKPYLKTVDTKTYLEQELFDAFDQVDVVEFDEVDESLGIAYLYKQGQAWKLDITKYKDKIDDFYITQRVKKDNNLRMDETDVRASTFDHYQKKNNGFKFLIQPENGNLQLWKMKSVGFDKKLIHRQVSVVETFFENTLGRMFTNQRRRDYGYPAGYTKFELSRETESIKFSVFSDMQYGTDQAFNFSWLGFDAKNFDGVTFLTVNYRRRNLAELNEMDLLPYYENDVGLYVLRKKIPQNINSKLPAWQLDYSGLHAYDSILGYINFSQAYLSPAYYWFWQYRPVPEDRQYFWPGRRNRIASPILKAPPASITFNFTAFRADGSFRLVVNGNDKLFSGSRDVEIALTLEFNEAELAQAFQKLSSSPDLIQLNLDLEEKPWGGELLVHLQNSKQKILLAKTRIN